MDGTGGGGGGNSTKLVHNTERMTAITAELRNRWPLIKQDKMYMDDDYEGEEWYSDEEELAAERELAEDAQWKVIQKNTFTRWCNEHLKPVQKTVSDIEFDLSDGLNLISLIEVLADKKFRHVNRRPNFRSQKLENVTNMLRFLEDEEGIKIVNIDSTDIIDSRIKLILGLIWTLILHYSISMPLWEGEEDYGPPGAREGPTPKQRLLIWVQNKIPELPVRNFTTDWNDGKAIGALVDAVGPGLCPDWQEWDPNQAKRNATEAMDLAEKWLDVPQLIRPEEMVNPKIDEQSMMTYLSQFPNAKLNPEAPIRPKTNAGRVRAYGPGLEPTGNCIGRPANFKVETFAAGKGDPLVLVKNPRGQPERCDVVFNNDRNLTYSCQYVPSMEGEYTVMIQFAGQEVPKSPFKVMVEGAPGDPSKVTAAGPGLEQYGLKAGKKTFFEVYTEGAGTGNVEIQIIDPHGQRDTTKPRIARSTETTYYVEYLPREVGKYTIHILFAGNEIPASPYPVNVGAPVEPKKCYATGRGIQPRGVRVGDLADIKVHTDGAGEGVVTGTLVGPGREEPLSFKPVDANTSETAYIPKNPGIYTINLLYGGGDIQKSPFKVNIGPHKDSNIRAYGPGLEEGIANKPADFVVETNGETGALGFAIEGPSQAKIDCVDQGDGSADVSYLPTLTGEYAVHVLCNNEDIPKSPFMAQIGPATRDVNPAQVVAFGPGLEKHGVVQNKWAQFTVDTRAAGLAPLKVYCEDAEGQRVDIQVRDNRDGTFNCQYLPKKAIKHTIIISYGGVNIPKSPYRVYVEEPSRPENVKVYGPGIDGPVKTFQPTHFFVDCAAAGPGDVAISLCDERGLDVPVQAADNGEGLFRIEYEPKSVGLYTANILFADQEIPTSPYKVNVEPNIDVSQVKVVGLEPRVFLDSTTDFTVDAKSVTPTCAGKVRAVITNPSGSKNDTMVTPNGDGTYHVTYAPFEKGPHKIDVTYENLPIPQSPFNVNVSPGNDPTRVKAYGPGLEKGVTNQPQTFTIETKGAGQGSLSLAVEGPSKAEVSCKDNHDGTCTVDYLPTKAGDYDISVKFAEKNIPGSPFKVPIEDALDPSKCRMYGPGLNPEGVRATLPATFTVDCTQAGKGPLEVLYDDGRGHKRPAETHQVQPGVYQCTYYPAEEGVCDIDVKYAGKPVPGSPVKQKILPVFDPSKVIVSGPGVENGIPASLPTSFLVDTTEAGDADLDIAVQAPDGSFLRPNITDNRDATVTVAYTPEECGVYQPKVKYGGKSVPGSPFQVHTRPSGNAACCHVNDAKRRVVVGDECVINVDRSQAGPGNVTARIKSPTGQPTDLDIEDNNDGTVSVYYTPRHPGNYHVMLKFGGVEIPGGQFTVEALPQEEAGTQSQIQTTTDYTNKSGQQYQPHIDSSINSDYSKPAHQYQPQIQSQISTDQGTNRYPAVDTEARPTGQDQTQIQSTVTTDYNSRQHHPSVNTEAWNPEQSRPQPQIQTTTDYTNKSGQQYQPHIDSSQTSDYPMSSQQYQPQIQRQISTDQGTNRYPAVDTEARPTGQDQTQIQSTVTTDYNSRQHHPSANTEAWNPEQSRPQPQIQTTTEYTNKSGQQYQPHIDSSQTSDYSMSSQQYQPQIQRQISTDQGTNRYPAVDTEARPKGQGQTQVQSSATSDYNSRQHHPSANTEVDTQRRTVVTETHRTYTLSSNLTQQRPNADYVSIDRVDSYKSSKPAAPCNMFHPVDFVIPTGPVFNCTTARVVTPSGHTNLPDIVDNGDGSVTIKYQPTETGLHNLHVAYNNKPIEGSPYQFYVDAVDSGVVAAYGPGLSYGVAGEPCSFTIDTKNAGAGGLSLAVEGPSKAEISCHDNHDGTCTVTFVPRVAGEYRASVKVNGQHIPGSPFLVKVQPRPGETYERSQFSMGTASEFSLTVKEYDISTLTADITTPSGRAEPCILKKLPNGHLGISFTPHETGTHLVNVYKDRQHIPGSPFKIDVSRNEVGDAGKVRVYGEGLYRGQVHQVSHFVVDTRDAGYGGLSLSVEGPSKADINCKDRPDGTCGVTYKPTQPGTYVIAIKFAEEHVPGSPFNCKIGGVTTNKEESIVTRTVKVVETTHAGSVCELVLKVPGSDPMDMVASVTSPTGKTELCDIVDQSDDHYTIKFFPKEMGIHTICIKHKGLHIPGSPFQFTVGPIVEGGAHRVHANGDGLMRAEVDHLNEFNIYTHEAGPGVLTINVEGPSKATILFEDRYLGSSVAAFRASEPGEYSVNVKFNDEQIPDSPFRVTVNPSSGGARKVTVQSLKQKGLEIGKPNAFTCVFNGATGVLGAKVVAPSGAEDEALIQPLDDTNSHYAVRFIPRENGVHYAHVTLNGLHIKSSPYRLIVGEADPDPGLVCANGEGLVSGRTGQGNCFTVDTVGTLAASTLAVTIDGPSKADIKAHEVNQGYEFMYTPTAPGDYLIAIKYGGNYHIAGSPFKAKVTGSGKASPKKEHAHCVVETVKKTEDAHGLPKFNSDASKVTSKGLGLNKAFMGRGAQFTVDTSQAGHNMLFCSMIGPAGSPPVDEVVVKHHNRNVYNVSYTVRNKGRYHLLVKYGDQNIPGSPFSVNVI